MRASLPVHLRFTSGATPANCLMSSMATSCIPYTHVAEFFFVEILCSVIGMNSNYTAIYLFFHVYQKLQTLNRPHANSSTLTLKVVALIREFLL